MNRTGTIFSESHSPYFNLGWVIWLALSIPLTMWGEYPRLLVNVPRDGFPFLALLISPLFHVNFTHLFSNLEVILPALILLYFLETKNFSLILLANLVASSLVLWIFGSRAIHIGLSGVTISLCFYLALTLPAKPTGKRLFAGGLFLFTELAIFLNFYQEQPGVSTDAHICGGISGLTLGLYSLFRSTK